MPTFSDFVPRAHPLAQQITIIRAGRPADLTLLALVRRGADIETPGDTAAIANYQITVALATDLEVDDEVVLGDNENYIVIEPPILRPDQDRKIARLELAAELITGG